MSQAVHDLYKERTYPALSHPATHPAVLAVAARVGGLSEVPSPASCRVLEMGCSSGHNLLPMAAAYPQSFFVGVDFSEEAIRTARESAAIAGLENIRFEAADLLVWQPGETFDFIIAHGVFSWVGDPVKERVLELCSALLTPSGVASIGYNTLPGWSLRRDAAPLIRAIAALPDAPLGSGPEEVVRRLLPLPGNATPYTAMLTSLFESMQRKGGGILGFDEFAPVCDPVYFGQFVNWAAARGLRYLGESDLAENLPEGIDPAALEALAPLAGDHVMFQQTLDLLSGRTHRNSLLCRDDAPRAAGVSTALVLDLAVMPGGDSLPIAMTEAAALFREALSLTAPLALVPRDFLGRISARPGADPGQDAREIATWVFQQARLGRLRLRSHVMPYAAEVPERPRLSALNLHFSSQRVAVVDAWHAPCHFPAGHDRLLTRMDGSLSLEELSGIARSEHPELDFSRWMVHLARRGLFV